MRTKKMRLMSFVLALAMMLAIAPVSAFADGTEGETIYVNNLAFDENNQPYAPEGTTAVGWQWVDGKLNINGTFDLSKADKIEQPISCAVRNYGKIENGEFSSDVYNFSTIDGGTFRKIDNKLNGTVNGGIIEYYVADSNATTAVLNGGVVWKRLENRGIINGVISGEEPTSGEYYTLNAADCRINDYIDSTAYIIGDNQKIKLTFPDKNFIGWKSEDIEITDDMKSSDAVEHTVSLSFTMPAQNVSITAAKKKVPLVIGEDGFPKDDEGHYNGTQYDGWTYVEDEKRGLTILTIYPQYTADLQNHVIDWTVRNTGVIKNGTFTGDFKNETTDKGYSGVVESGVFTPNANFGNQNPSRTWVNVKNGTLNNAITGMAIVVGEQKVTVTAKVSPFKGWVYSGDVSDAVAKQIEEQKNKETMTLTLNGDDLDSINLTAKTDGESFEITMLDGKATVDKTDVSAAVPGRTVTLSIDDSEIPEGMSFDHWVISPEVEPDEGYKITDRTMNFTMPAQELTIYASLRTDSDDGTDAMTVVAGVAIGAGAAVLTYHIGTELYAKQVLGDGVAVPKTREEVALKAWELAGKPAVAVEGEPLSEAAQAEQWAVKSGLMQNVDGSFNGAKKMNKLKALRVLDSAKKMNAQ